jgi:hypothetical protein
MSSRLIRRAGIQPQRGQRFCQCELCTFVVVFIWSNSSIFGQVLSKKHEEQLLQLTASTSNLDFALQAIRKSVQLSTSNIFNIKYLQYQISLISNIFKYLLLFCAKLICCHCEPTSFKTRHFYSSSSCQCPDVSAIERSLDAATSRIAVLEITASRISELEAAVARLTAALESKMSPPSDPH